MAARYNFDRYASRSGNELGLVLNVPITFDPNKAQLATRVMSYLSRQGLWDVDAAWKSRATFADGRPGIICGGGGCNIPNCNFQMWNIDAPCDGASMENILSQAGRYARTQLELERVLNSAPTPIATKITGAPNPLTGASQTSYRLDIEAEPMLGNPWYTAVNKMDRGTALYTEMLGLPDAKNTMSSSQKEALAVRAHRKLTEKFSTPGWGAWAKKVLSLVALMRWSSNLRWYMAVDGDWNRVCPNEWGWLGNAGENLNYFKFYQSNAKYPNEPPMRLSLKATGYNQMGTDGKYSWSDDPRLRAVPWPRSRDGAGADTLPPLVGGTNDVPVTEADFAPDACFFQRDVGARANPVAYLEPNGWFFSLPSQVGPQTSFWKLWPDGWNTAAMASFESQVDEWIRQGLTLEGSRKFVNGEFNGLPHPYYAIGWAASVAVDSLNLDFFTATVQGMIGWTKYYEKLPENLRTVRPADMYANLRAAQRTIDDQMAAYVGGTLTAVGGVASSILAASSAAGPWGAVVGAVVAALTVIVGLFIAFAYEIGISRMANPPCPAPPFVRMIPTTGTTSVCDFDANRLPGANSGLALKATAIQEMSERGMNPSQWYEVLASMEAGAGEQQQLDTGAGGGISTTTILIGAGVVGAVILLASRRK